MTHHHSVFAFFTPALLAFSACAIAADAPAAPAAQRTLSAADNGKTISIPLSQKTIQITLEGNPTTGYSWSLAKLEGKSIALNGDIAYKQNPAPRAMVGVGGVFTGDFDVKEVGQTIITLDYKRPWETTTPAAKSVTIIVNVVADPAAPK